MRAVLLAVVLLASPLLVPASVSVPAGPTWWETTTLDADGNHIDDALEALATSSTSFTVLVDYARMPTPSERAAVKSAGFVITQSYTHFPILAVQADAARIGDLAMLPGVVLVEMDDAIHTLLKESVPLTGAPLAWESYGVTGKGITVAVIDDGAFEGHPDFSEKIAGHYDAGSPATSVFPVGTLAPAGSEGHGTHVAGTIVGQGGQSDGTYKGVAPGATFANVKVFTAANETSSSLVLNGLDWVLSNMKRLDIRVASMSVGGRASDGTDSLSRAVNIAVDKGLVVVAAAGNAGDESGTIASPGAAEKAITVGAVDKQKRIAPYSSRGPTPDGRTKPDLVAPGTAITSTIPPASVTSITGLLTGKRELFYGALSGTSMAAPHVSGIVALMLEANPDLTPFEVKQILLATAQDLGEPGVDNETGYGFGNAIAAVQVALNPALLDEPRFASVLATIPEPAKESFLDRFSYEASRLSQDPKRLAAWIAIVAVSTAAAIATVVAFRRS